MKLPRLTEPMVRENGKLVPVPWDVALTRAAEGIRRSVTAHGPSTFGIFSCSKATNEVNYAAQKLIRGAVGSNNIDSCNRT
jgi:formate dehydrogenase (hydrogenase)